MKLTSSQIIFIFIAITASLTTLALPVTIIYFSFLYFDIGAEDAHFIVFMRLEVEIELLSESKL